HLVHRRARDKGVPRHLGAADAAAPSGEAQALAKVGELLEFLWEEKGWLVWHEVARPAGEGAARGGLRERVARGGLREAGCERRAARGGLREAGCECGSLFCAFSISPPLRTNPGH